MFFACLCEDKFNSNNTNKRQKLAQDFLNSIDQTGELLAMFEDDEIDDVKQERMEVFLFFSWFSTPAEKTEIFHISCWSNAFFMLHIVSVLHVFGFFSFCPDGLKEFPYFSYSLKFLWICKHTCWEGRLRKGARWIFVCHVFVFFPVESRFCL